MTQGTSQSEPHDFPSTSLSHLERRGRALRSSSRRWPVYLAALSGVVGPGLMVMLADTDAGSVVTAAQSGASFRYIMVLPELLLIPILYLVQEMTVRLGVVTQRGHAALITEVFGRRWATLSAATLFVACVGALVTEFAGVAGVGELVGLHRSLSVTASALALVALIVLGRYRRIEHVGIAIGALELLFLPAALAAHPHLSLLARDLLHPWAGSGFPTLLAANVGAVIMPWMIFYQQEAVIDRGARGLDTTRRLASARLDTAVGAILTQIIMVAIVVATAAVHGSRSAPLSSIGQIASALAPFLGHSRAVVFFGLGMVGASVVAALVVSLAGAWAVSEVFGWRHSLNDSPKRATGFYALAASGILTGAALVLAAPNLVKLSIDVEILNAALLPIVLGFLIALESRALPEALRMKGARRAITYLLVAIVMVVGLATAALTLLRSFV